VEKFLAQTIGGRLQPEGNDVKNAMMEMKN
jgi:hypothetical protein